jgi:hypothetical protein
MQSNDTKEGNLGWRLTGDDIWVRAGSELAANNFEAGFTFASVLEGLFVPSDAATGKAAAPDDTFTDGETAVFHVLDKSDDGGTTLKVYHTANPTTMYTRHYDGNLDVGGLALLAGPTVDSESDRWSVSKLPVDAFSAPDPDGEGIIYYKRINLDSPTDNTVMVVSGSEPYSGKVTVPAKVNHDEVEYIVTQIGPGAFAGDTALTEVVIENGITTIGERAFEGCTALISVALPESLTTIGDRAFSNCSTLTEVDLPDRVTSIPGQLFDQSGVTRITISTGMTVIGPDMFGGAGSSVVAVSLPGTVTEINGSTFAGRSSLTSITLGWTTAGEIVTPDPGCFDGTDKSGITLYVPPGTKAIYKAHPFWSVAGGFKAIVDPADHTIVYGPDGDDTDWTNN